MTLQQLAKPGGFDLQVQRVSYSSFDAQVSGKAPLYVDGYFGRPTTDTATYPFLHSGGSWNAKLWHYSNPAVDAALTAARLSGEEAEQKAQYIKMQEALNADPAGFFAYSLNFACAYGKAWPTSRPTRCAGSTCGSRPWCEDPQIQHRRANA